ncbi:hypothetical protein Fcan01_00927 [Folsomia candida]|uniref:Uncharacterized protein n=1 Tax=Folsomia candida TaxID=158441 RepID=A0A226EZP5_FOLCA|nr:hypothetical protein Fcan01_00927 [Folsomia candida]
MSKRLRLITLVQTLTPLKALQRFTRLSEFLYPQRLSFDRVTWQPTPTAKSKLIPWYFLSILCAIEETSFYFILFKQILAHQKDPEVSGTLHLILLISCICYSFSTTIFFTYHSNVDEICFVIRNTLQIKENQSSNLTGFFFHGIISFIVMVPLGGFVVTIRTPKLDPTYLWFRDVSIISCGMKLFLRILPHCSTLLHSSVLIFGFTIINVNIILSILRALDRSILIKHEGSNFLNVSQYITRIRTYRQLQIITQGVNQFIRVQTFTPLKALQRFSILSEFLYPQRLSFNRATWEPTPTPKSKLIPCICYSLSTTICFTYHSNADEICFVIRNTLKIKDQLNESSNLAGIFFHGLISFIVKAPLVGFVVMVINPKLDPTYLWFRNVSIISCGMKLCFRILLYCSALMHISILIFGFAISGVNIIASIVRTLDRSVSVDQERGNFLNISQYVISIRIYRELQILTQVINQFIRYVIPVGALIFVLLAAMLGFMVIKMAGKIPFALVFLDVTIIGAILGFIQIEFSLMADVMRKSTDFKKDLEFQGGYISYRKRQLRSLKVLKIWVGSYFFIHKGTRIKLFGLIAYYTVSLVISF